MHRPSASARTTLVAALGVTAVAVAMLTACAPEPQTRTATVARFDVVDESFTVELATPELIAEARALLAGGDGSSIPNGIVVRDDASVNEPWSWHIDPATLEFAFQTTEVCDGIPSFVEDETVTSAYYCPWSAKVVAVEEVQVPVGEE